MKLSLISKPTPTPALNPKETNHEPVPVSHNAESNAPSETVNPDLHSVTTSPSVSSDSNHVKPLAFKLNLGATKPKSPSDPIPAPSNTSSGISNPKLSLLHKAKDPVPTVRLPVNTEKEPRVSVPLNLKSNRPKGISLTATKSVPVNVTNSKPDLPATTKPVLSLPRVAPVALRLNPAPLKISTPTPAHSKVSANPLTPDAVVYDTSKIKPKSNAGIELTALAMTLLKPNLKAPEVLALKPNAPAISITSTVPALPQAADANHVIDHETDPTPVNPELVGICNSAGVYYEDLNSEQRLAVNNTVEGYSFCLTGAAGSGKTTTQSIAIEALLRSVHVRRIPNMEQTHKYLHEGAPSVVIVSFTNKAVENIRKLVPQEMKSNCMTIHKLLEYAPIKVDDVAMVDGQEVEVEREVWRPRRDSLNPLEGITHIFMEEGSNVGMELTRELKAAMPYDVTLIVMGDINQLQPVGDTATLGYAMACLPEVNLKKVYRQGTESPILTLAHKILAGLPISDTFMRSIAKENELIVTPVAKHFHPAIEMKMIGTMFKGMALRGDWDADNTVALLPFHKGGECNVLEFNRYVAQGFTERNESVVYEIINGYLRSYYCIGDIVFQNKQMWTISSISENPKYAGVHPKTPSKFLNRWGDYVIPKNLQTVDTTLASIANNVLSVDDMLASVNMKGLLQEDSTRQSSHIITLEPLAKHNAHPDPVTISASAECNDMQLGYGLTYHKSQGSEWETVHVIAIREHQKMVTREHLYTACTRARKTLHLLYATQSELGGSNAKPSILTTGVLRQEVKGTTPEDKREYFLHKIEMEQRQKVLAAKATARTQNWPASKLAERIKTLESKSSVTSEFKTNLVTRD